MLNPAQQLAVETTEGPVRILAGAGTGKTHTLISRVDHLLSLGKAQPHEILVLTFTNKAANELNERLAIQNRLPVNAATFHSLAAGFLRQFWKKDFAILTSTEQEEIVRDIIYSQERDELKHVVYDLNNVRCAVACGAEWPKLLSGLSLERMAEVFAAVRDAYDEKNAIDFTGLLTTLAEVWKEQPESLITCQKRYRYVMVDEYQDVNALQIHLVRELSEPHNNLCVVGDPDQTIYSWRGADAGTLAKFADLYPDSQTITLTQNYRNAATILKGAEQLIAQNPDRLEKTLTATVEGTHPITLWESRDEWQMNEMIFNLLEHYLGSHDHMASADRLDTEHDHEFRRFSDIAILYRTQAQGRLLAAQLAQKGYPYQLSAMPEFWEHKEIKGFMGKLKAMRDVGTLHDESLAFSEWFRTKLEDFIWHQSIPENKAQRLVQLLQQAMAFDHLPLKEALVEFLNTAETAQDADNLFQADKINLLTLHAAKGLEFPIVFILGLEEGTLPHHKLANDPYWLAEERRLMYVGMTRAKEELHLFRKRAIDSTTLEPSRFLTEIGTDLLSHGILPEKRALTSRRKQVKKAQIAMF